MLTHYLLITSGEQRHCRFDYQSIFSLFFFVTHKNFQTFSFNLMTIYYIKPFLSIRVRRGVLLFSFVTVRLAGGSFKAFDSAL